jgi:hypothetical protein
MKIKLASRFFIISGIYFAGSLFALANFGVTAGFSFLDFLVLLGFSTWITATGQNLYYKYQAKKEEDTNLLQLDTVIAPPQKTTHLVINGMLQMTASTTFFISDARYVNMNPLFALKMIGSIFWFVNAALSTILTRYSVEESSSAHCSAHVINEITNEAGAIFYMAYALSEWSQGNFMPLRIIATTCWILGAAHDLITAHQTFFKLRSLNYPLLSNSQPQEMTTFSPISLTVFNKGIANKKFFQPKKNTQKQSELKVLSSPNI